MELFIGYKLEYSSYPYDDTMIIEFNKHFRFYVDFDANEYIIELFLNRLCYLNDTHVIFEKPKLLTKSDKFYAILNNTYDHFIDVQDILNCQHTIYSLKLFKEAYKNEISILT